MFTGIIEAIGIVKSVDLQGSNRVFWIESPISQELKVDQSVSHNGVCLTVEEVSGSRHRLTAIDETLSKTNLGSWEAGTSINLERSLTPNSRLDGHIVQGHVDAVAKCIAIAEKNGSVEYSFRISPEHAELVIEKGSICINGISLTAFNVGCDDFTVAIIPFTLQHTNMPEVKVDSFVNIEFDILGKYILRKVNLSKQK